MTASNGPKPVRADVARVAGVAESTVSRALNDSPLISPEVKEKVRLAAFSLGYVPSRQAAMFARNRSGTIGLVVPRYAAFPPFSRAYFPAVLDGVVVAAEQRGCFVTIILNRADTTGEELAQLVTGKSVDGLLFAVTPAEYSRYSVLEQLGLPFVLISNYHESMNSVDANPEPGMRKAVEHACSLGHRTIGYVTGDLRYKNGQDRLQAFNRLVEEFGVRARVCEGDFSRTSGYRCAGELLAGTRKEDEPPSLVMAASDRAALGVLAWCKDHEIDVPGQVSLIGFDDLHPAQDAYPPLSTVCNPIRETGAYATDLLLDIVEGVRTTPTVLWLDTDFVHRQSTAPVRGTT
ncbi:MAG: LacI family transcriptional regulator [Spirochaetaceae bacterium]|nr:MAG: LacI family transcriptional regulator [Spirochaetaceae bacterium]